MVYLKSGGRHAVCNFKIEFANWDKQTGQEGALSIHQLSVLLLIDPLIGIELIDSPILTLFYTYIEIYRKSCSIWCFLEKILHITASCEYTIKVKFSKSCNVLKGSKIRAEKIISTDMTFWAADIIYLGETFVICLITLPADLGIS